ncbi:MAG: LysM domain-containing protein [Bacillota bacterium]|nr:LysM domain-containing protein [Bacillota bacterium]
MNLASMRFCGYTWRYNPKTIKISDGKNLAEINLPNGISVLQDFGQKDRVITGEGELFGDDAFIQYNILRKLYEEKRTGILSIPNTNPFVAVFSGLSVIGVPAPNLVQYSFTFREDMKTSFQEESEKIVHIATDGETLFTIANKYETTVEKLLQLNPNIRRPNEIVVGESVTIC